MADSDKNIVISPQRGSATLSPEIVFTGKGADPITLRVTDADTGALNFEGSEGQLFGISNSLSSGKVFSANFVSGIPAIDVDASGLIRLAPLVGSVSFGSGNVVFDGNVGIGTTDPLRKLVVHNGSADDNIIDARNEEVAIMMGAWGTDSSYPRTLTINGTRADSESSPKLRIGGQGGIEFAVDLNNVRAVIDSSGNVGIGTTSPSYKLHVVGDINFTGSLYQNGTVFTSGSGSVTSLWTEGSGDDIYRLNGNVGIGTTSPTVPLQVRGNGTSNTYRGVIRVDNSGTDKWAGVAFPDNVSAADSQSNNYYFIGRGSSISDRTLSVHVPNASDYGSGSEPIFGIFSTNADKLFHVQAATGNGYFKGNVGIGTTNPTQKLEVNGNILVGSSVYNNGLSPQIRLGHGSGNLANGTQRGVIQFDSIEDYSVNSGDAWKWKIATVARNGQNGNYNNSLEILRSTRAGVTDNTDFSITRTGNVGIGTTDPLAKLHVYGNTVLVQADAGGTALHIRDNSIENYNIANDGGEVAINYAGLGAGFNNFRNFNVYNGKGGLISTFVGSTGYVGIGTNSPSSRLAVNGYITESTNSGATYWNVVTQQDVGTSPNQVPLNQYLGQLAFLDDIAPNSLRRDGGSVDDVYVDSDGDVGIGTSSPTSRLHIASGGNIRLYNAANSRYGSIYHDTNGLNVVSSISGDNLYLTSPFNSVIIQTSTTPKLTVVNNGNVGIGITNPAYKLDVNGDVRAERYRAVNSLILNSYQTVNPGSNVFLYSQPNDRDSWIYLDSADTGSNWGIYHRQIDSTVNDLPGNSIGFIGGGNNQVRAYISLWTGDGYFSGNVGIGTTNPTQKLDVEGNVRLGTLSAAINFTDSGSTNTRHLTLGANQGDALLVTHAAGYGVGYFGYEAGGDRLIIACDNGGGNNKIDFSVNAGTTSNGTTDNINGIAPAMRIAASGNVGINTTAPLQILDVRGKFLLAADASTSTHITQVPYTINNGTLSWEGTAGQLFSITNNLTSGSIFSVNDVSGLPSIDVDANGTISLASFGGNVGIGTTNPSQKLDINGNIRVRSGLYDSNNSIGTSGYVLTSTGSGVAWAAASGGGGGDPTVTTSATNSNFKMVFANTTANTTGAYGLLQDSESTLTYNPSSNTLVAGAFSGSGASLTSLNAGNISSGIVGAARLGSGTANSSTYLRGNNTWGDPFASINVDILPGVSLSFSIGSSSYRWNSLYLSNQIDINGSVISSPGPKAIEFDGDVIVPDSLVAGSLVIYDNIITPFDSTAQQYSGDKGVIVLNGNTDVTGDWFKVPVVESASGSVWTTTSDLLYARDQAAGAGSQSAGLVAGGYYNYDSGNSTEEYNGATWISAANININRYRHAACGTQSAALIFGGEDTTTNSYLSSTEIYDSITWSTTASMPTYIYTLGGCGTTGAALAIGGRSSSILNSTYHWGGSSWYSGGNLLTARSYLSAAGTESAALATGGFDSGFNTLSSTEEYNGWSWSSGGWMLYSRYGHCTIGSQNSAAAFGTGGYSVLVTEEYNGMFWSTGGNLNVARSGASACGTQSAGLVTGGYRNNYLSSTEEYTGLSFTPSSSGELGMMRYNKDTNNYEAYDGTQWRTISLL